jgi:phenylacetate-coenzyme A ligase PaaK-like adenylate-forming protein
VAYHHTSGTTGKAPLRVFATRRDWDWGAFALSAMWQAVNDLGLGYEFLYDRGV